MKQEFKKIIEQGKHIIKIISSNGYEAYFTGETVRNILLDLDVIDVEISTNAPLENVERILSDFESARADDNILAIRGDDVVFMIRRFQSEYRKKKNEKAIFSDGDDIISDLKTRIFSIDSMAINLNGKITDICDVCFWEYDEVAQNMPDKIIGANKVSLNTAKKNYKLFGAAEKCFINMVRQPYENEI